MKILKFFYADNFVIVIFLFHAVNESYHLINGRRLASNDQGAAFEKLYKYNLYIGNMYIIYVQQLRLLISTLIARFI